MCGIGRDRQEQEGEEVEGWGKMASAPEQRGRPASVFQYPCDKPWLSIKILVRMLGSCVDLIVPRESEPGNTSNVMNALIIVRIYLWIMDWVSDPTARHWTALRPHFGHRRRVASRPAPQITSLKRSIAPDIRSPSTPFSIRRVISFTSGRLVLPEKSSVHTLTAYDTPRVKMVSRHRGSSLLPTHTCLGCRGSIFCKYFPVFTGRTRNQHVVLIWDVGNTVA